ncbi:hypothetical protein FOA43_002500 [Brettanomyces nanus]|uniref:TRP C-terminal domain-containing protein n=1 Tax=Eeniella nana TaxID=13502 RepID=A0A875S459_EENNA|nr:uncharacterized protein FOA43_002500 [Brettanomyces nanus]QPG75155.1 hypothetical protein FOA43_002500 [Brettanomyces nanus]
MTNINVGTSTDDDKLVHVPSSSIPAITGEIKYVDPMFKMPSVLAPYKVAILSYSASLVSTAVGFPLDSIKTRMQTHNFASALECFKLTLRLEGFGGLFRGIAAPLISTSFSRSLGVSIFARTKPIISSVMVPVWGVEPLIKVNNSLTNPQLAIVINNIPISLLSGGIAGSVVSAFACPFELTKIFQQIIMLVNSDTQTNLRSEKLPTRLYEVTKSIVDHEGARGLYSGYRYHILRDSLSSSLFYGLYETVKMGFQSLSGTALEKGLLSNSLKDKLDIICVPVAGALAGCISWITVFPIDTVKSQYQRDVVGNIVRARSGLKRLPVVARPLRFPTREMYKGLGPSITSLFEALMKTAFLGPVQSAFVRSYNSGNVSTLRFTNFLTNVSYLPETGTMDFQLRAFALEEVVDVNSTTNMYTTIHFRLKYVDDLIVDQYLRLCDYASVNHMTSYYVPKGVFTGIENLFSYGGTMTQTVSTLVKVNGTQTSTSLVEMTTEGPRLLNSTDGDVDILPVGIQKRYYTSGNTSAILRYHYMASGESPIMKVQHRKDDPDVYTDPAVVTLPQSFETVQVSVPTTVYSEASDSPSYSSSSSASSYATASSCPIFKNNEVIINLSAQVGHRSAFGSFELEVEIISPDAEHSVIGYTGSSISTVQNAKFSAFLSIFFASLLGVIFLSNLTNIFLSPYQDSQDVYLMSAAMICNAPLLNQVTPLFVDFIHYLQFIFFMAALNLNYPGFFSPLVASFRWVALLGTKSINGDSVGNVYQTIYTGGLKALLNGAGDNSMNFQWMWLLINFIIFICGYILVYNVLFAVVYLIRRLRGSPVGVGSKRSCLCYNMGVILYSFLSVAAIPLLTVSLYIMATYNSNPYGGPNNNDTFAVWCVVTGALVLVMFVGLMAFFGIKYVFSDAGKNKLYTKLTTILIWNLFYSSFNVAKVAFVLVDQSEFLIFSIVIGCAQSNGVAQLSVIIVTKSLYLVLLVIYKPYYSKTRMNRNKMACSAASIIVSLLHVPFVYHLDASDSIRTRFIWAISIIHLLVIVTLFLLPTMQNIYLCFKWYYKYRKGDKGTDIPDYRDDGDFIELPFSSDNRSLTSDGTFADLLTMPPLSPSVSGILHDSSSEINTSDSTESARNFDKPLPAYTQRSTKDWMAREVDMYYNARRILDPDPEVRQLWEERGRKLVKANNAFAEKTRTNRRDEDVGGTNIKSGSWMWLENIKKVHFSYRRRPPRSFEVMRPHPLIVNRDLARIETRYTLSTYTATFTTNSGIVKDDISDVEGSPLSPVTATQDSDQLSIPSVIDPESKRLALRVVNTVSDEDEV